MDYRGVADAGATQRGHIPLTLIGGLFALLLVMSWLDPAAAQSKPATVAELATYEGADRQKILEEGARKEGQIVQYGTFFEDTVMRPLFNKFKQKYPYLNATFLRSETNEIVSRMQAERQANRNQVDVVQLSAIGLNVLKNNKLIRPYLSPSAKELQKQFLQPEHYWVAIAQSIICIGYNTNVIKPADVPKSYEDLLDPKLKGKIFIPNGSTSIHWLEGLWETKGEAYVHSYAEKLKANQPRLRAESARAVADLVAAGQVPVATGVLAQHVAAVKDKGAPIACSNPDPVFSWVHGVSLAENAQHPHAALLWVDWLLSLEGAQALSEVDYIPTDTRAKVTLEGFDKMKIHVIDEVKEVERQTVLMKARDVMVSR
jgi:iron(III) transport system substrate-binding protein